MALSDLRIDTKACDFIWVHTLSNKLVVETAKEWQLGNVDGKMRSMDDYGKFLDCRAEFWKLLTELLNQNVIRWDRIQNVGDQLEEDNPSRSCQSSSPSCPSCKQSHRIYSCSKFVTEKYR